MKRRSKSEVLSLIAAWLLFIAFLFPTWSLAARWVDSVQFYLGAHEEKVTVAQLSASKTVSWGGEYGNQTLVDVNLAARSGDGRTFDLSRTFVAENREDRDQLDLLARSKGQALNVWLNPAFPGAFSLRREFPFSFLLAALVPFAISAFSLAYIVWDWRGKPGRPQ